MHTNRATRVWLAVLAAAALVAGAAAPAAAAPPNRTQTPAITAKPVSPTGATTATFSFASSTAGAVYSCSLDGGAYATCTSPWTYSGMKNGGHSFSVKAQAPGARASGIATATWTVDTVAPIAPTVTGPPALTKDVAPVVSFSSTSVDVVGYRCSLDGADFASCSSGSTVNAPAEGGHQFTVVAVDGVGNQSSPTTIGWAVDSSVKAPFLLSGPPTSTSTTSATFAFLSEDADATLECRLDGGAWTACTSPASYTGLGTTGHSFQVRATDPVGNTAVSELFTWTVGATPITFEWTNPGSLPSGVTNSSSATFDFAISGATTVECTFDAEVISPCATPVTRSPLSEGLHAFRIVVDKGLASETKFSYAWVVDTTAPGQPTISAPSGWVASTSAQVVVTAAGTSDALNCTVDGAATPCSTGVPLSLSSLAEGLHVVTAVASDKAGNISQQQVFWNVDSLAPVPTVTAPTSLTGPVAVAFDDEVTGGDVNPVLELVDGTEVPTTRTCRDGAGVTISCTLASRRVVLTPVAPLVPGQTYVVSINKVGTTPVVDLAGNPADTATPSFRGTQAVQENSPAVAQTWRTVSASGAKGASYVMDRQTGARATWSFTGTSFTVYPVSGPSFGYVAVYVDGVKKALWNQYSATTKYTSARTLSGLSNTKHTVVFAVAGKKGSTKATGWAVGIDAVKVGTTLTSAPKMTFTWSRVKSANASGLYKSVAVQKGQTTSMSFVGTSLTWTHSVGRNHGKADVWIDGVKKATVDLFGTTSKDGVAWTITGLAAGKHTVKIVATGTKRTGATGTLVTVDRFLVG